MNERRTTRRYAKVFFEGSRKRGLLEPARTDLLALRALIRTSADFASFLQNLLIPQELRLTILDRLFKESLSAWTQAFLRLLERHRKLHLLNGIATVFEQYDKQALGLLEVTITSARPLEPGQSAAIEERIANRFHRKLETVQRVDPSLLGGFKVQAGDMIFDLSLTHQLERLNNLWANA